VAAIPPALPFRPGAGGLTLTVRLTPKSSRDEVEGLGVFDGEPVLKARVRALPSDGAANQALCRLIAKWLKRPASAVSIAAGGKSRLKQVRLEGEPAALQVEVEAALAALQA
jgi:uncharacterized protein YggU (UPF0235/DUF167 family)